MPNCNQEMQKCIEDASKELKQNNALYVGNGIYCSKEEIVDVKTGRSIKIKEENPNIYNLYTKYGMLIMEKISDNSDGVYN